MNYYVVEFKGNGYTSLATDCDYPQDFDRVWNLYEELCEVEAKKGSQADFDAVLAGHGCSPAGAGIMYNSERQGFPVERRSDGTKVVKINGVEYEIVNTSYVPGVDSSFFPSGFWSSWQE